MAAITGRSDSTRGMLDDQLSDDDVALEHIDTEDHSVLDARPVEDAPSGEIIVEEGQTRRRSFNNYPRKRSNARRAEREGEVHIQDQETYTRYEDFTTIDWVRDTSMERKRQIRMAARKATGWYNKAMQVVGDAWQGWVVVFLTGVFTGVCASVIDIGTDWLSDMKMGICPSAFWLNQNFCCWTSRESNCPDWMFWYEGLGITNAAGQFIVGYVLYILFAVGMAVYCSLLVLRYGPYAAGSGIPEVKTILSGFVIRKFLGLCTLLIKIIGLVLSVSSGLSLGKEGPFVHVGCCVANVFSRIFVKYRHNEAKKRELMSAACAAGVSVAFGAPIGGVLFSLEEVSYYFPHKTMWRSFFCALTAATTLQYLDPFRTGRLVMFYVQYDTNWHLFELPAFVLVGVLGGLYGAFFARANVAWCRYKARTPIKNWPVLEVAAVTAVTALLKYPIPYLRMSTTSMIHQLFDHCYKQTDYYVCQQTDTGKTLALLALSAAITAFITIFTFGIKVPAGLFIPSMAVGTLIGRMVGVIMEKHAADNPTSSWIQDACHVGRTCVEPGLYAVVGAAAFLSGVTRTTVSLVVIMFELTGGLMYIIPVMVAVLTSKWVGDATGTEGIYDEHIKLRGYPYLDARTEYHHDLCAGDVMHPRDGEPPLCVLTVNGNTLGSLLKLLEDTPYKGYPLIDTEDKRALMGYVNRTELQQMLASASNSVDPDTRCYFTTSPALRSAQAYVDLRRALDRSPIQVVDDTPMEIVIDLFRKMGLRYVLVTAGGELAGVITKKDILHHLEELGTHKKGHRLLR
eukprot:comp22922_c0_seq1/m.36279 comp22922_c0_seq1/g.36279  ORF comp22922_c0_seq1/g.36279 comp22922_c0_seq1/m.36279 type:complete len:796 (-) comp22922_c0_seq1:461-2848(-)